MKFKLLLSLLILSLSADAQERLVKVNGNNFTVDIKGFENRQPNTPALIFENGLGVGLGH